MLVTTGLAALSTTADAALPELGVALRIGVIALSVIVNAALFLLVFRVLTARDLTNAQVVPGAVTAGMAWQGPQTLGAVFVTHELRGATATYGLFGLVLGLLGWIYLQSLVVVLATEVNVVRVERIWPRALLSPTPFMVPVRDVGGLVEPLGHAGSAMLRGAAIADALAVLAPAHRPTIPAPGETTPWDGPSPVQLLTLRHVLNPRPLVNGLAT
ncbi:MAG: hypothetical protein QOG20_953 [Pseudonocardiales bacterium]|uniref:YhjD/YihY/BrkB family envelope integrity protein n=1 Tax=Pseudonocardia sp. TaxID=60912 RepID=UPI00262A0EC4|nr:YhjD/YihY/BrkB family envelope integrity protein [Pseudonocardia sp.]MCW2722316.1 ribonuclease [Pseudonocardia sp.]MDT7705346.1 hypothetical protein [Pseudonocardiales bacterium]